MSDNLFYRHHGPKEQLEGFPGGPLVENPPCKVGEPGLIAGPGKYHMHQGNEAHVLQLKPECLEPMLCNKRSHHNEKPEHCN